MQRAAGRSRLPTPRGRAGRRGLGKASVHQLLNKLAPGAPSTRWSSPRAAATTGTRPKTIRACGSRVDDLLVRFAGAANPLPGDQIVGFITRGRGLTVHARDCLTVARAC